MSDSCPTLKVKSGDSYAIINESDFDDSIHELYAEEAEQVEEDEKPKGKK